MEEDDRAGTLRAWIVESDWSLGWRTIDVFKVPHHGSKNNLSNELMNRLDCKHFPVSSSGRKFNHPDDDAIARIIFHRDELVLHFNYRAKDNKDWDLANWKKKLAYETAYPTAGKSGLVVEFEVQA